MVAIAVDNAGFKLNLKDWTPTHYWGPGLVDQLISNESASDDQRLLVVSFSANLSEPAIRCADFAASDPMRRPDGSGLSKCETLNSPVGLTGNVKGGTPWQQLVGQQQLMTNALTRWEDMHCMSTTELRENGFVLNGALPHTLHTHLAFATCAGMHSNCTSQHTTHCVSRFEDARAVHARRCGVLPHHFHTPALSLPQRNEPRATQRGKMDLRA